MNRTRFAKTLMAAMVSSGLLSGIALAEGNTQQDPQPSTTSKVRSSTDNAVKKVENYIDDSAITAKVKAALVDDGAVKSTDISVKTEQGVVTLSGHVAAQDQLEKAVARVQNVEGVKSVNNELKVGDSNSSSVSGYAGDAATTSEIKAKLLADDVIQSRKIKVETTDGVVQLSGDVASQAQSTRAESIAKDIQGVKSVKNDLTVKP